MPTRSSYAPGTPNWVDLATPDPDASRTFYGELFGWTFDENPTDQGSVYIMASKNSENVAGMMELSEEMAAGGMPPAWTSYVSVDDIDAAVKRVDGAGGQVVQPPFDVMESGRMAVCMDPGGAGFCLWEPGEHIGATLVNEPGAYTWNELVTPDVDGAVAFYGKVFDWVAETMEMPNGAYTVFTLAGDQIGGAMNPPMEGIPPHWGIYFTVADADETASVATEGGAGVVMPPTDTPVGRLAAFSDPHGAMFSIMQPAEQ